MPFPNARSRITLLLEQLCQGDFIRVKTLLTSGKENAEILMIHMHVHPLCVTAGQETTA